MAFSSDRRGDVKLTDVPTRSYDRRVLLAHGLPWSWLWCDSCFRCQLNQSRCSSSVFTILLRALIGRSRSWCVTSRREGTMFFSAWSTKLPPSFPMDKSLIKAAAMHYNTRVRRIIWLWSNSIDSYTEPTRRIIVKIVITFSNYVSGFRVTRYLPLSHCWLHGWWKVA